LKISLIDAAKIIHEVARVFDAEHVEQTAWDELTPEQREAGAARIHHYLQTGEIIGEGAIDIFTTVVAALK
jgi:hypothetical protein